VSSKLRVAGSLAALFCAGCYSVRPTTANALLDARDGPCSIRDFKVDGSVGARWNPATRTLAYARANPDGHFHVFLSDADGSRERRLFLRDWREDRHQFAAEWHPSGKYLFVEIEKPEHPGSSKDAIPGYGAYTDLWLVTPDGEHAWKLVDEPNDFDHALTHLATSPDGSVVAWTERIRRPNMLDGARWAGSYVFRVATFVDGVKGDAPRLEDVRAFIPGEVEQGGEVDGVSPDGHSIAFYSTYETSSLIATHIYTWDLRGKDIVELSTDSFSQAPRYTPNGESLVYMSGSGADIFFGELQGADWWVVGKGGENRRRLTFMNRRGSTQSVGHYRLAGVISFDSDRSFYGDVLTFPFGLVGKIVKVTCDAPF
jgi:Tol biopolymer transport system component